MLDAVLSDELVTVPASFVAAIVYLERVGHVLSFGCVVQSESYSLSLVVGQLLLFDLVHEAAEASQLLCEHR